MPLQQLCSLSDKRAESSNSTFISTVHGQDLYDADKCKPMERCASLTSTLSFSKDICRICHCEGDLETILIVPCYCTGSLRYVHQSCLQQWIKSSDTKCCELCKFPFIMNSKVKPFQKWERLDMSGVERRKVLFSVFFHLIAITCVVWSLYVLVERTFEDVENGELEWPFWTKLIVMAIGFAGGIVFTYVQCKMYVVLLRRWRAYNRVIWIQNAPEKTHFRSMETSKTDPEVPNESQKLFLTSSSTPLVHNCPAVTVPKPATEESEVRLLSSSGCVTISETCPSMQVPELPRLQARLSLHEIPCTHKPAETDSLLKCEPDDQSKPGFWRSRSKNSSPRHSLSALSPSRSAPSLCSVFLPNVQTLLSSVSPEVSFVPSTDL